MCDIFNDQSFNDTLTNYIVSFEQLGPGSYKSCLLAKIVVSLMTVYWFEPPDLKSGMGILSGRTTL